MPDNGALAHWTKVRNCYYAPTSGTHLSLGDSMKRALICFLALAVSMLLPVVGLGTPEASAQIPEEQVPGHAIDVNESGEVVIAAVKESGRLYTRTYSDGVPSEWHA